MEPIKPRITQAGYRKALHEYGQDPSRIIEELVANSYDADATVVLVIHSEHEITVVDNGSGISDDQFPRLLDLGAGTKIGTHESELKRSFLGSFGFGIKATINIAKAIAIYTLNKKHEISCDIDVSELEKSGFEDEEWAGFPVVVKRRAVESPTGTVIRLRLRNDLAPDQLERIRATLYNIPKSRDFSMYLLSTKKAGKPYREVGANTIAAIKGDTARFAKDRITGRLDIGTPKIYPCDLPGSGSMDVAVWCNGLDTNLKVPSLGQFAGVYVKVDGRVLKRNFQGEKVLDGISKYPKFKHGMRIEVPIDWVKQQISLGRDGLQFSNEASKTKFENELKSAVSTAVRPFAKQLENRKAKKVSKAAALRLKRAKERIEKRQQIKELVDGGYAFKPTDDYEMALLIANPIVLKKLNKDWVLMDFNGQMDFDCLVYEKSTTNYKTIELEPRLESFLGQGVLDNTDYIVTWTRGDWKVGKARKGKRGWYELIETNDGEGQYKLLVKTSAKSKEPRQSIPVYCVDTALGF